MAKSTKATKDTAKLAILNALDAYKVEHPKAKVDVQRDNPVAVRIRIIDPDFSRMDLIDRDSMIWDLLESVPDEVVSQVTMLLLLTPKETKTSFANMEFEHPAPSVF